MKIQQRKRRNSRNFDSNDLRSQGKYFKKDNNVEDNKLKAFNALTAVTRLLKGKGRVEDFFRWGRILACLQDEEKEPAEGQEEILQERIGIKNL